MLNTGCSIHSAAAIGFCHPASSILVSRNSMSPPLTYANYLDLEKLLTLQKPALKSARAR